MQQTGFFDIIITQIERMKTIKLIFIGILGCAVVFHANAAASKCSKTNLTRCLDSACAINIGINPSARCQYCGTSAAGVPPAQKGLTNVTAGQSTKYALSDKELKVAPSDPGKRYVWASTECIKKLPDCTPDDISDTYDKLIEQSCRAAGASIKTAGAVASFNTTPTQKTCNESLTICITKKCGASYDLCQSDSDFDKFISECAVDAKGCDEYIAEFRTGATNDRKAEYERRENVIQTLVQDIQTTRADTLAVARAECTNDAKYKSCMTGMCENHMANKCNNKTEKAMAELLCKYYKTACAALK